MTDTSFQERLQRIERSHADAARAAERRPRRKPAPETFELPHPVAARRKGGGTVRAFGLGFLWLFATMSVGQNMNAIQETLAAMPQLEPHASGIMLSLAIAIAVSMIAFAWTVRRAAFGAHKSMAGVALALGAVAGLIVGVGPVEFMDLVMADMQAKTGL